MLYLKKYFTEGLIQMAILLSLCGVRVDVGLEPYLPDTWHEMILGPTSALTQTQFHNLRNRLEDGQDLHPKSVDLDEFFTARRLLGWVRSLDRIQVPHTELETWLVQQESSPLPVGYPHQPAPLDRAPMEGGGRPRVALPLEPRDGLDLLEDDEGEEDGEEETHHIPSRSGALDEIGEEEEDEENLPGLHRHFRRRERGRRQDVSYDQMNNRELIQHEVDQTSVSLQECLRLLDETFPFTEQQQGCDGSSRGGDVDSPVTGREPLQSPIIPSDTPTFDLGLQWQDLLHFMEPENTDVDMMTFLDHALESPETFQSVNSEPQQQNYHDNSEIQANQDVPLMDAHLPHGLMEAMVPLMPSADLNERSSDLDIGDTLKNLNMNNSHSLPYHMDLLEEDLQENLGMDLNANLVDDMETSLYSQYASYPENFSGFHVNLSTDFRPSISTSSLGGDSLACDLTSPGTFLLDEEDEVDGENGIPNPLNDMLVDASILDDIRLLDLALEEGFSPEIAARLEEGHYDHEIHHHPEQISLNMGNKVKGDNGHSGYGMGLPEDQPMSQQDGEDEAGSDSGLSLDFSYSPASPCTSEASSYSSSSSSTSTSSCAESLFSHDEEGLVGSDVEVEVMVKQEEQEEEVMGAVGGGYYNHVKKFFPPTYGDNKLFNGFPWSEHISHDHTYNQPLNAASSPRLSNVPPKHIKSSPRHDKPFHPSTSKHTSEARIWSRDERRARALKIPISNEFIVNLPVEEFNEFLANHHLSEEQLNLIRDIRRRGKNKIAAQNCRKRKMDVLLGLEDDVSVLRRRRSRLLREKQEALRTLQDLKRRLSTLYQEVFSRLRDEEGRPLDATEYLLNFGPNDSITVASHRQGSGLPLTGQNSKKQKGKKK
ncbi:endoplasmic reticulum membrane sensor NFE2L1a isoform X2 [Sphaeramia orbicularis]|uniref:endoplasmic reticulum membrane sensor NFE2L1a isoform X2 n=1 Tax=Sphaeramia orbicularis TaxID=375764 RepID=UPI00117ED2E2|nr:endoplasmic reticulum membrane sensor NFE2L1-like isoform X2 [Sphaeramia orbicularis]